MNKAQKIGLVLVIAFGASVGVIVAALLPITPITLALGGIVSFAFGFKVARSVR